MFVTKNVYQNDDAWKTTPLGNSSETLGSWGCLLTSVTMMLNGIGYDETPVTVNEKMKKAGGGETPRLCLFVRVCSRLLRTRRAQDSRCLCRHSIHHIVARCQHGHKLQHGRGSKCSSPEVYFVEHNHVRVSEPRQKRLRSGCKMDL